MKFIRTQLSAAVAWAMIPLAAWAGMPTTACVCANGHVKFFCQHALGGASGKSDESCRTNCCASATGLADEHDADCEHDGDCCGGGFCCHGSQSAQPGVGSKACCKPILSSPSVAPKTVSAPSDHAAALAVVVPEVGALIHPTYVAAVAVFDTGPPLDRVIVFRTLLI